MNRLKPSRPATGAISLGVGLAIVLTASAVDGAGRDHSADLVRLALRQEVDGSRSDREAFLQAALKESASCAAARWHSGFVRAGEQWVRFDEIPKSTAADSTLAEYRKIRGTYPETIDGRLRLADWCKQNGLHDQERAHLTQLLEMSPDHADARRRLGFRRVGGAWLSDREIEEAQSLTRQTLDSLKCWQPNIEKIGRQLASKHRKQREIGRLSLLEIDDPQAIPAMELVLANQSEEAALLLVQALSKRTVHEATLALARQAVFSPFESVREAAAKKLQPRNRHDYVPALLAEMQTPVQSRAALFHTPGRRLICRHVLHREGQYSKQLAVFDTAYNLPRSGSRLTGHADRLNVLRNANDTLRARKGALQRQNEMIRQRNEQICSALAAATGQDLPPSPEAWWEWWNDEQAVYVGDKQWEETYQREERVPQPNPRMPDPLVIPPPPPPRPPRSCLVAGTPVWTDRGPVAIDRIQVGDRVLSKEPETGRLEYKPVLRTTVRPPSRLLEIGIGREVIETTLGHPFWVSGSGWMLAQKIEPGARFHGAIGPAEIGTIKPGGSKPAYNLVVADFHTYFVGAAKILSHDNTTRKSTNRLVPGLSKE